MLKLIKRSGLKAVFVAGLVGLLSSCSSTELSSIDGAKKQSFALAATNRFDPSEQLKAQKLRVKEQKRKLALTKKKPSKSSLKAKIASAKKQADSDAKRLANFDKMLARLPESQVKYFSNQRASIATKKNASKAAFNKLQYAAMPRSAGKGGARYHSLIAKYAAANGIPLKLAHAVVRVESAYRANARGGAGEIGLMQLKLATARGMGYRGSAKGLYDPATNIRWGMKYLGKAHQLSGGSTCGTILKYNAGHGAKRMNPISARYCKRVRRYI